MFSTSAPARPRIGILGGSFNPPHLGHLFAALYALEVHNLQQVRFAPAARHPFGKRSAPFAARCVWVTALIEPYGPRLALETADGDPQATGYTIDLLDALAAREPDRDFVLILGGDQRADVHRWQRFSAVEQRFGVIWIERGASSVGFAPPAVSSTEARDRIARGEPTDAVLPARVRDAVDAAGGWEHGEFRPRP